MNNSNLKWLSLTGIILWLIALVIIPALLLLVASFLTTGVHHLVTFKFTLSHYHQLFNPIYLAVFAHSFITALSVTIICLIIGYPAAFFIAQANIKIKPLLLMLLLIPFWTSSLIRTYAMMALLKTKGLLNTLFLSLHIIHLPLQLLYSNTAVLIGLSYALLPYMILPIYTNVEKMDTRLFDAAKDLGASSFITFRKITLPLTLPGIISGVLLVFLPAMTLFYIPVLLGGGRHLLLGNLIETQFLEVQNWPGGAVTSLALTLIMFILIILARKFSQRSGQTI